MGLSRKPNKFGLDPFLMVDTAKANYYYGRTDVPADDETKALKDAAVGADPTLDRTLPWILLVRGMFSIIYKDILKQQLRRQGYLQHLGGIKGHQKQRNPNSPLPSPIVVPPHEWARAFNIITFRYVSDGFLKRPRVIKRMKTESGREIALALLVQDPGKGRDKMEDYLSSRRRRETVKVLRRMERHRLNLGENQAVQEHLASLRPPTVAA